MFENEFLNSAKKSRKRVWRWDWSWHGRTAWRWDKWQNARKSWWVRIWFEWGQTPLHKRLPKLKWFSNARFKKDYNIINVSSLNKFSWKISLEDLQKSWLIANKNDWICILWNWEIKSKIILKASKASKTAISKIEKVWWTIELIKIKEVKKWKKAVRKWFISNKAEKTVEKKIEKKIEKKVEKKTTKKETSK